MLRHNFLEPGRNRPEVVESTRRLFGVVNDAEVCHYRHQEDLVFVKSLIDVSISCELMRTLCSQLCKTSPYQRDNWYICFTLLKESIHYTISRLFAWLHKSDADFINCANPGFSPALPPEVAETLWVSGTGYHLPLTTEKVFRF